MPTPVKSNSPLLMVFIVIILLFALGAAGYFAYQNWQLKQQISQVQPTPTPQITPTTTPDPTADWKTYTNSVYSYSFKYPNDWKTRPFAGSQETIESAKSFSLETEQSDSKAQVSAYQLDGNTDLETWITSHGPSGKSGEIFFPLVENVEKINYGSLTAIKFKNSIPGLTGKHTSIATSSNKYVVVFVITNESDLLIIDQILSTIKFTDQTTEVPKPIADLFQKINTFLNSNITPVAENEFYSPSGMITKKSWKLDFKNVTVNKSLISFLRTDLQQNDAESGGIGGGGTDAYENDLIKCFHTYMSPMPDTTPFPSVDYLSCAMK
jgi:hypothetical protein